MAVSNKYIYNIAFRLSQEWFQERPTDILNILAVTAMVIEKLSNNKTQDIDKIDGVFDIAKYVIYAILSDGRIDKGKADNLYNYITLNRNTILSNVETIISISNNPNKFQKNKWKHKKKKFYSCCPCISMQ